MEYRLVFSELASSAYNRILDSFHDRYDSIDTVRIRADEFSSVIEGVCVFPHRFLQARGAMFVELEVRYVVFKTYVLFFSVDDNEGAVTILRIFDYRADLQEFLGEGIREQD